VCCVVCVVCSAQGVGHLAGVAASGVVLAGVVHEVKERELLRVLDERRLVHQHLRTAYIYLHLDIV